MPDNFIDMIISMPFRNEADDISLNVGDQSHNNMRRGQLLAFISEMKAYLWILIDISIMAYRPMARRLIIAQ